MSPPSRGDLDLRARPAVRQPTRPAHRVSRDVARPATDPRFRARRAAVHAAATRRRTILLAVTLVGLLAVGGAVAATFSTVLDVDHVVVTGAARLTPEAIADGSGVRGEPLLLLDRRRVATRVEAMPWVRSARVTRDLPGTVRIVVTERSPVAWAAVPTGVALVDGSGRVLAVVAEAPNALPELAGLDDVGAPGERVAPTVGAFVAARLTPSLRARTQGVGVVDGDVTLAIAGGPEVRLGEPRRVDAKARAAEAVLAVAPRAAYVDVRVPRAPVSG